MRPEPIRQTVHRLSSAAGHLWAVGGQLEAGVDRRIVLAQLAAVQAALEAARRALVAGLVADCARVIRDEPSPEARESELARLLDGLQQSLGRSGWRES